MTTEIRPPAAHQRPSGRLYLSADQLNLVSGAATKVELDTISAGFTDGIEDTVNHRITPGVAGFYSIIGQVTFVRFVSDKRYRAFIRHSTSGLIITNVAYPHLGAYITLPVSGLLKLTATEYIELWARSDSGDNTVDVQGGETYTSLSVQRVR